MFVFSLDLTREGASNEKNQSPILELGSQRRQPSINSGEIKHLKSLNEPDKQQSVFHVTNLFASDVEELTRLSAARAEIATGDMIPNMFLYDLMSDNISNAEQNSQMAFSSLPNSSRASSDIANLADGTAKNLSGVGPPLKTSENALGDWPISKREQATSSNIKVLADNMKMGITLVGVTPQLSIEADPLGPRIPMFSACGNAFPHPAVTPSESHLQNYTFTKPPLLGPSTLRLERTISPHSGSGSIASPNSTITGGIKETEAIREDLGWSMAQLKQIQAELAQENSDHARRAEVLMKEMDELRRGVIELKMEARINQDKMETSMASVKGLTEKRISEMTAIMAQRDQKGDERLKLISETMHRRDREVDKRMVDLMTTVPDLTLGVKTVVATAASRPPPVPVAPTAANVLSTDAFPTQQPTYREIVQRQSGTKPDQRKLNLETVEVST